MVRDMTERTLAAYTRAIRPLLPAGTFKPARTRLLWLPVHLSVIVASVWLLARHAVPWFAAPGLSVLIGSSFAGITFLGHETLHGAILRQRHLRHLVGWIGFSPFVISPRLWVAWHNRVHHGNTNHDTRDPDAYPTLELYRRSLAVRVATSLAPGLSRVQGLFTPFIGFSVQSLHMLFAARGRGYLSPKEHWLALLETSAAIGLWSMLAVIIGPLPFLFAFALPLLLANAIVMSFILTNHSLSPLTDENDPLANSLTVTTPRLFTWLTLGFGYHVEHHLFPAMSSRHAPKVQAILLEQWPSDYQAMPLVDATIALHTSPRVYKDATTLIDPISGRELPALAAHGPVMFKTVSPTARVAPRTVSRA